jgi:hypothetical protein
MGNGITKVGCVFQRTLVISVVGAAIREKHVGLVGSGILFIFLYLLRIHFSYHHSSILIAVTVTV